MRSFGVIPNITRDSNLAVTKCAVEFLISKGAVVYMSDELPRIDAVKYLSKNDLFDHSDCIITVGGDGTIIHAAKPAALKNKPMIGINCGRVGFIAEIEKDEIELLDALVSDRFDTEERSLLEIAVDDRIYHAFNDAVIAGGTVSKIMDMSLFRGNRKIDDYHADGMVFSTPTGSTAYNLSAGGPVVDATLKCIVVTPICSHSLSSRTMIFSEKSVLNAVPLTQDSYLTIDGEMAIPIAVGQSVTIKNSEYMVKLIKIKNSEFYEVLQSKINGNFNKGTVGL